jgi:hypothetical protein
MACELSGPGSPGPLFAFQASTFCQVTSACRDIAGTVDPGVRILEFKVAGELPGAKRK